MHWNAVKIENKEKEKGYMKNSEGFYKKVYDSITVLHCFIDCRYIGSKQIILLS